MYICTAWKSGNSLVMTVPKQVAQAFEIRDKEKMALRISKRGELVYRKLDDMLAEGKK